MDSANPLTADLAGEDWAGEMGERWLASLDRFESMISPVGAALLTRAAFSPGERVIDVGCGGGTSTREIAASVAPGGVVMGLDISPALVAEARRRAAAEGVTNATFSVGDAAEALPAGAPYDRLFSRFGTMFFADPPAAFRNLGRMVRSGGRADLAVWAPAKGNPWVAGLLGIVRNHLELPTPAPGTPGPFSLDDPERLRLLLEGGGFDDIDTYFWQGQQLIGGAGATAASAASFVLESMSFGRVVAAQPQSLRDTIEAEIREHFAAHQTPSGVVMGANAWLVSARRL